MSKVDERIVEMKFENHLFNKNAESTINVLEKLKSSLNFTGAEKSLSNVQQSASSIDFSKLAANVESLSNRFSNWGIVGMTVIQDLTRAAENLANKLVNGVMGQIKSGGWSRATNIDKAKFSLEGLGIEWNKISADINYGVDQTAYGLDAAASAASQLAASGVEFGDAFGATGNSPMAKALKGISGVAAQTNAAYEEISSIYTTVAGQGKLMTMQLRQLESRGLNVAAQMGKVLGYSEAEIRDMVTQGLIDFQTFSEAMYDSFGEHASKANETFEGSLANMKSALSRIGAEFATPIREDMVPVFNALRERINEIKKEHLGPLFSDFSDFMGKFTGFIVNVINKIDLSFLDNIIDKLHEAYQWFDDLMTAVNPFWKSIQEEEEAAAVATEANTDAMKRYDEAAQKVLNGEYGNGEERRAALEAEGLMYELVQNKVNELLGKEAEYVITEEQMAAALGETTKAAEEATAAEEDKVTATEAAVNEYVRQQKEIAKANERQRTINKLLEKAKPIAKGLVSAFSILKNTVKAFVDGAMDPLFKIGTSVGSIFLDILGVIGKVFTALDETLKKTGAYEKLTNLLNSALSKVAKVFESIAGFVSDLTADGGALSEFFASFSDSGAAEGAQTLGDSIGGIIDKVGQFLGIIRTYLKDNGGNALNNLIEDLSGLFPILKKLWPIVTEIAKGILVFKGGKALAGIFDTIALLPETIKANVTEKNTNSLLKLAGAISVLAIAFYAMSRLSWEDIAKGATAIGAIAVALAGLYTIVAKMNSGKGLKGIIESYSKSLSTGTNATAILKVAGAFAILAASMFALSQLSWEQIAKGAVAIGAVTIALSALLLVIAKTKRSQNLVTIKNPFVALSGALTDIGKSMKGFFGKMGIAALITAIGVALIALGNTVKVLSEINWEDGLRASAFVGILLAELVLALLAIKKVGNDFGGLAIAASLISLSEIMKTLSMVVMNLKDVSWDEGIRSVVLIGVLIAELTIAVLALDKVNGDVSGIKISLLLYTLSQVVDSLSETVKNLASVSWDDGIKSCTLMGILFLELATTVALISSLERQANSIGTAVLMGALALVVKSLSGTVKDMQDISWEDGIRSCTFMGLLFGELAIAVALISKVERKSGSLGTSVLMASLSAVVKSLSGTIKDLQEVSWDDGIKAIEMLGLLFLELVATLAITSKVSDGKGALGIGVFVLAFASAVKMLASSVKELAVLDEDAIERATSAVSKLGLLMSGLLVVTKFTGGNNASIKSVVPIILMIAALAGAVYVLASIDAAGLDAATKSITKVLKSVSLILAASNIKIGGGQASTGSTIAAFAGIAVLLAEAAVIFYLMRDMDINQMLGMSDALSKLFKALAVIGVAVGSISTGEFVSTVSGGAGAIVVIDLLLADIVAIEALAAAVNDNFPGFKDFLEKGFPLLEAIGEGLGRLIGSFLNEALLKPIAESFGDLPTKLTEFVNALSPFLDGSSELDSSGLDMLEEIMGKIVSISAQGLIGSVLSAITGEEGMIRMANEMEIFAKALVKYSDIVKDNVDEEAVAASTRAATMITEFAKEIPNAGGLVALFTGDNTLTGFANQLNDFAPAIVTYSQTVSGNIDEEAVAASARAAQMIIDFAKEVPNSGGLIAFFTGDNTLTAFAQDLAAFGPAIAEYSAAVDGKVSEEAVAASTRAATMITDFAKEVPNAGGLVSLFTGEKSLTLFAQDLEAFGPAIAAYSAAVDGKVSEEAVAASSRAAQMIIDFANDVPNAGGLVSLFTGEQSLTAFARDLRTFGPAIAAYSKAVDGKINVGSVMASAFAGKILAAFAQEVPETGGLISIFKGDNSLTAFASQLEAFAPAIAGYSATIVEKGGIDEGAVQASANAGRILASFAQEVPETGGIFSVFTGDNSLSAFASELNAFAPSIVSYSEQVAGKIDVGAVMASAFAGKILAAFAQEVPTTGGLISVFTGDNSLSSFAEELKTFGPAIAEYSEKVDGKISEDAVAASARAAQMLVEFAEKVPDTGGLVSIFTGDNDLTSFANQLKDFAPALVTYSDAVKGHIDVEAVKSSTRAATMIAKFAAIVPETGGLFSFFTGDNSMTSFGEDLAGFGEELSKFSDYATAVNMEPGIQAVTALSDLIHIFDTINADSGTYQIEQATTKLMEMQNVVGAVFLSFATTLQEYDDQALLQKAADVIDAIGEILTTISTFNVNAENSLQEGFNKLVSSEKLFNDVKQKGQDIIVEYIKKIKATFEEKWPAFENKSLTSFREMFTKTNQLIVLQGGLLNVAVSSVLSNIARTISNSSWLLNTTVSGICNGMIQSASAYNNYWWNLGVDMMNGLANGISWNTNAAVNAAINASVAALNAAKAAVDSNSPSKAFEKLGADDMRGLAIGIEETAKLAVSAAKEASESTAGAMNESSDEMINSMYDSLKAAYLYINAVVAQAIDSSPTITPVIDLSKVKSGVSSIDGMLSNATFSIGNGTIGFANSAFTESDAALSISNIGLLTESINGMRSDLQTLTAVSNDGTLNAILHRMNEYFPQFANSQVTLDSGETIGNLTPGISAQMRVLSNRNR